MGVAATTTTRRYFSRSELAQAFNVTPQRITIWASEGMPVADRGGRGRESRYDLAAVVDWQVQRRVQQARESGTGGAGGPVDLAAERARLTKAQTARALLEIGLKRRELLPAAEVEAVWGGCVQAVRTALLAIPQAITERCTVAASQGQAAVEAVIKAAIYDALRSLAHGTLQTLPSTDSKTA